MKAVGLQGTQHVKAIQHRHGYVQNHEVRAVSVRTVKRVFAVLGNRHGHAVTFQGLPHQSRQIPVIFGDKDSGLGQVGSPFNEADAAPPGEQSAAHR